MWWARRPRSWCARNRWTRRQGQKITIRPLAGTRPRGATPEQDKAAEQELVNDPKERAEHVMLIDLARNDIGRIAKTGSVKVTEAFAVERYSHVMHIVSNVEGMLNDGMTSMDVLKATFPAGTLTGAPKVHAMELIDQLEPVKRGLYGGACGYLSYAGDMDVAIAIRTGIVKDQHAVRAGRGRRGGRLGARDGVERNRAQGARAAARRELVKRLGHGMKLLMIDNYDSFTYNIVQYFGELGAQVEVFRNDEITVEGVAQAGTAAHAWQDQCHHHHAAGRVCRAAGAVHGEPLPLAGDRARDCPDAWK
jgi:hypothetical protein